MHSSSRSRSFTVATGAALLALTASGCGAIVERATEEAVERAVEAENGGDVEVDFDADSGTFTVESDDGDVSFELDEDGVQIEGTDANGDEFSLEAGEDGITAEGEGGESIQINEDGSFTSTDENGEVTTGDIDTDTGEFTVENEDGESIFRIVDSIPEEWPSDVPEPSGLSAVSGQYFAEDGSVLIAVVGTTAGDVEGVFDDYGSALEAAGFNRDSTFTDAQNATSTFTRGDATMSVSVSDTGGATTLSVTYSI